jgi:hypothetical protein
MQRMLVACRWGTMSPVVPDPRPVRLADLQHTFQRTLDGQRVTSVHR